MVQKLRAKRLAWAGQRMEPNLPTKKVFSSNPEGDRRAVRPRTRLENLVQTEVRKLGITNKNQQRKGSGQIEMEKLCPQSAIGLKVLGYICKYVYHFFRSVERKTIEVKSSGDEIIYISSSVTE